MGNVRDEKRREEKIAKLGGQKNNSRSFDAGSIDPTDAIPSGQKDVLASNDMPSSGPGRQLTIRKSSLKKKKKKDQTNLQEKRGSQVPIDIPLEIQQESDGQALTAMSDKVDEYYYGIRIFPGQDPAQVWVGWVTTQYHFYNQAFNASQGERKCRYAEVDHHGITVDSVEYKNCFMMNAAELLQNIQDVTNTKVSGTLIGCIVDTSIGELTFQVAGQDTGIKFKLEPGAMLFPAAFVTPTATEILQFELGRIKYTFPLSAAMFKSCQKSLIPFCPPRLTVERLEPVYWARVITVIKNHVAGWSVLCDDPVRIMTVYVPEKDESFDVLEIIEKPDMLDFHRQTLNLYCKLASHGNQKVAHILCRHVDEDQIMYAVKSHYLSGPMRQGFHDLLIALHLKTHASARQSMSREYVIPLVKNLENKNVFDPDTETRYPQLMGEVHSMLSVMVAEPVKTHFNRDEEMKLLPPTISFDALKSHVMSAMESATRHAVMNCRDLIGGNNLNHFEPLLKLFDCLLVIGLITDTELEFLLKLIHPSAFDPNYETGTTQKGLTEISLAEGVKVQLVSILDHICDVQLRHRVESLVSFTEGFVGELQQDQCKRYMEIKQTDMPPAEAAKKTKEFRCPPKEQMFRLLMCKVSKCSEHIIHQNTPNIQVKDEKEDLLDDEVEYDQCPMAENLQQQLRDFCGMLVRKIGNGEECDNDEQLALIETEEGSWVG
uniref:B30.2/SPRY domain-containing protein n=1 Tax=Heterorhabditis bacteriophora TaxID=37862 RepID=A0A1I7XMG4_HETBA